MKGIRRRAGPIGLTLAVITLAGCSTIPNPRGPARNDGPTNYTAPEVGGSNLTGSKHVGPDEAHKTIQSAVDAAAWGDTIVVRAGTYREQVRLSKSVTILGERGATIKGSDLITEWWPEQNHWATTYTTPRNTSGGCQQDSNWRCQKADQVFIDGEPQFQETSLDSVGAGDFFVGNGKLYLGTDPTNRTVEVSTRDAWILGQGRPDVTIKGLKFTHAANPTQTGGIRADGPRWLLEGNDISHAHSAGLALNGEGSVARGNYLHHNGQNGLTANGANQRIIDNTIAFNNTEEYDVQWEASGAKFVGARNLTVSGNEAFANDGPGLWCDIGCDTVTISNNNVHHNKHQGIHFEISRNAVISHNVAWENGHDYKIWPLGSGILVQNSSNTQVHDNLVAWNGDGIGIIQGSRGELTFMRDNSIHDNVIAGDEGSLLGVVSNADGSVFQDSTNNRASNNRYYRDGAANWTTANQDIHDINHLNTTPIGGASRLMNAGELAPLLAEKGIPATP